MPPVQPLVAAHHALPAGECGNCPARTACMPQGLTERELAQIDVMVNRRYRVRRGSHIFRAGMELHSLAAVRCGSLKSTINGSDGREQVAGFHLPGELLGLDAIADGRHTTDVIALEDSEVCRFPYAQLHALSQEIPALGHHLRRTLSREITRTHQLMIVLGSMRADERVAAFLLDMINAMRARGFSATQLVLRMTRNEIGSYLGLKLETVSRTFSALQRAGVVEAQGRMICIVAPDKLTSLLHGTSLPELDGGAAQALPAAQVIAIGPRHARATVAAA